MFVSGGGGHCGETGGGMHVVGAIQGETQPVPEQK